MPRVAPDTPPATPEYDALVPHDGEGGLDALARVGEDLAKEFGGSDTKDPSRRNKKLPKRLGALVMLRAQGFDNREIAARLGVTVGTVKTLIAKARKEYGWSDLGDKIMHRAIPQAVDNVIAHLDHEGTEDAVKRGQNVMTLKTLAGVGVFKTHSAVKQDSKTEATNILRVEIALPSLPSGDQGPSLTIGSVIGTPRRALVSSTDPTLAAIDGHVVNEKG